MDICVQDGSFTLARAALVPPSYWQKASILPHVYLSTGLLDCPHNMAASFIQHEQSKSKNKKDTTMPITG